MMRPCLECGEPADGPRCPDHTRHQPKPSARSRGYNSAWDQLSRRARKLQPWCTDCGSTEDLQADHLPEAWERHNAGQPIRLQDIEVCCGPCNRARGNRRTRGATPNPNPPDPLGEAKSELQMGAR